MNNDSRKLRGSYSTPYKLADFLVNWAIQSPTDLVLEPSCGDGVFLEAASRRLFDLGTSPSDIAAQLYGIELDADDSQLAVRRLSLALSALEDASKGAESRPHQIQLKLLPTRTYKHGIVTSDFFKFYNDNRNLRFDVVVGNPPFIRYQNWKEEHRTLALQIMEEAGLKPNRLTNAWAPFVLAGALSLKPEGRLAMVVPAELLQVKYASQLRMFLADFFQGITVIVFRKLVFPKIQQEIVLLLGSKSGNEFQGITLHEFHDSSNLDKLTLESVERNMKPIEHTTDKWIKYLLTRNEILLLRRLRNHDRLVMIGELAEVDVGIVTGKNRFFVIAREIVDKFDLWEHVIPLVGRTMYLKGAIFNKEDWAKTDSQGAKCYLLNLPAVPAANLSKGVREYLAEGESQGVHTGYKCRIRKCWHSVPSIWVPDIMMFRQIGVHPRVVLNEAAAVVTDTIHRVRLKKGTVAEAFVTCFHNSLSFAYAEVLGRSYGGGVLELEPNEAEEIPIPYFEELDILGQLDRMIRRGKSIQAIDTVDREVLQELVGLPSDEIAMLKEIWQKLSGRRMQRK